MDPSLTVFAFSSKIPPLLCLMPIAEERPAIST